MTIRFRFPAFVAVLLALCWEGNAALPSSAVTRSEVGVTRLGLPDEIHSCDGVPCILPTNYKHLCPQSSADYNSADLEVRVTAKILVRDQDQVVLLITMIERPTEWTEAGTTQSEWEKPLGQVSAAQRIVGLSPQLGRYVFKTKTSLGPGPLEGPSRAPITTLTLLPQGCPGGHTRLDLAHSAVFLSVEDIPLHERWVGALLLLVGFIGALVTAIVLVAMRSRKYSPDEERESEGDVDSARAKRIRDMLDVAVTGLGTPNEFSVLVFGPASPGPTPATDRFVHQAGVKRQELRASLERRKFFVVYGEDLVEIGGAPRLEGVNIALRSRRNSLADL